MSVSRKLQGGACTSSTRDFALSPGSRCALLEYYNGVPFLQLLQTILAQSSGHMSRGFGDENGRSGGSGYDGFGLSGSGGHGGGSGGSSDDNGSLAGRLDLAMTAADSADLVIKAACPGDSVVRATGPVVSGHCSGSGEVSRAFSRALQPDLEQQIQFHHLSYKSTLRGNYVINFRIDCFYLDCIQYVFKSKSNHCGSQYKPTDFKYKLNTYQYIVNGLVCICSSIQTNTYGENH